MSEVKSVLVARDVAALKVPHVGRVQPGLDRSLPWRVVDEHNGEVLEVSDYLRCLTASDFSAASVKSYAGALLRWLRFLWAVGVDWDRAGRVEVRDFVLWLRTVAKPARRRRSGAPAPGSINRRTGKRYLGAGYAPATINHNLAVVSGFYDYQLDCDRGPLRNPVPQRRSPAGGRPNAHHNPLEPFASQRRAGYRQRVPRTAPRAIPDGLFDELFAAMGSDRDRAILALYVSSGARPAELLGCAALMSTTASSRSPLSARGPGRCSGCRLLGMRSYGCGAISRPCRPISSRLSSRCGGRCAARGGR